jgi:undecaprenyl-diphosphatase
MAPAPQQQTTRGISFSMSDNLAPENTPASGAGFPLRSRSLIIISISVFFAILLALLFTNLSQHVWVQVILLGIVEGLTEFLPISSTAHLLIVADLLHFEENADMGGTFEIVIQLGAVLAVVGFYARNLLEQARTIPTRVETRRFWFNIALAFLPAAVLGLLLRDWIKEVIFESPTVIAGALIVGGIVFIVVERLPQRTATVTDETRITWRQALGTGVAQVTAFIPGVSRSGASIVGGMLAGLNRPAATAFSFYLAIPTLGAATVVDLLSSLDQLSMDDLGLLLVGTVVSGIVAWFSIGWLLRYVATNSFVPFGIYRIIVGCLILLLVAVGIL